MQGKVQTKVTKVYMPTPGKDAWKYKLYLADVDGYVTSWKLPRHTWLVDGVRVTAQVKEVTSTQGNVFQELVSIELDTSTPIPPAQTTQQPEQHSEHEARVDRCTAISAASRLVEGSLLTVAERLAFVRDVTDTIVRYVVEGTWDPDLDEYIKKLTALGPAVEGGSDKEVSA